MKYVMTFLLVSNFTMGMSQQKNVPGNSSVNIYDKIFSRLCDCFGSSGITDSTKRKEYCYQFVLNKNYEELKAYGVDTVTNKDFKRYYDLYLKRYSNKKDAYSQRKKTNYAHDDSFLGSLVNQQKISTGEYEVTLKSNSSNSIKKFISAQPIDLNELKRFTAGDDNIIIAYQTVRENGKEKYIVKSIVYIGKEKK